MNKKSLIRVVVASVIAVALLFFFWSALVILAVPVWIYLVWMVRKKKTTLFRDQIEPKLAKRSLKMLKVLLLIAVMSLVVGIIGVILHNVSYAQVGVEEAVFFSIALASFFVFVVATAGSLFIFLRVRREWAREIWQRLIK